MYLGEHEALIHTWSLSDESVCVTEHTALSTDCHIKLLDTVYTLDLKEQLDIVENTLICFQGYALVAAQQSFRPISVV